MRPARHLDLSENGTGTVDRHFDWEQHRCGVADFWTLTPLTRIVAFLGAGFPGASASGGWKKLPLLDFHPPATRTCHFAPQLGCGRAALAGPFQKLHLASRTPLGSGERLEGSYNEGLS